MINNRLLQAIQTIARSTFPSYPFLGKYRYRVVRKVVHRYELQVVDRTLGLPDLLPIAAWNGMAGVWCDLALGSIVLVEFIEGKPSMPIITHYSDRDDAGWKPTNIEMDAATHIDLGSSLDYLAKATSTSAVVASLVASVNAILAVIAPPGGAGGTTVVTIPNNPPTIPLIAITGAVSATTKVRAE